MNKYINKHKIYNKFDNTLNNFIQLPQEAFFILMLSGGCDSTALAYLMTQRFGKDKCCACHINHMLRNDAKTDEGFVKDLSEYLNIELYSKSFDVAKIADENKQNIEQAARTVRYSYAKSTICHIAKMLDIETNRIFIATAHTQNDRAENFYMRSIVGTGPGGFAGMPYRSSNLIRPLLDIPRTELEDFVINLPGAYKDANKNFWKIDQTNYDTDRFRAFVRHNIIPLMIKQNSAMLNNLTRSMNLIAEENQYMEKLANVLKSKYIELTDDSFIVCTDINNEPEVVIKRAIYNAFRNVFPADARINNSSIEAVLCGLKEINYKNNIQNDYAVHSTKRQVVVEPMKKWQIKRKRI